MVEKNIRLKTHLGNGVYDTLHPETNSKIVRVGEKNLDETLGEVTAQLAQTETDIASDLNKKRDKTIAITLSDLDTTVKTAMTGGSVAVVDTNSTGTENVKLGAIIPETTSFLKTGGNLFNKETLISGFFVNSSNGNLVANSSYNSSDYIPLSPNSTYSFKSIHVSNYAFYDKNKVFVTGIGSLTNPFVTPSNVFYMRICEANSMDGAILSEGNSFIGDGIYELLFNKYVNVLKSIKNKGITVDKLDDLVARYKLGKNLFNKNTKITSSVVNYGSGISSVNSNYTRTDFVKIKANTNYAINLSGPIAIYTEAKGFLRGYADGTNAFNSGNDAGYMIISLAIIKNIDNLQIEEGTVSTTLEAYRLEELDNINGIPISKVSYLPFSEKAISTFGDSITAQNTWQPHLISQLGFDAHNNYGSGGTTVADLSGSITTAMCRDERINQISIDSDVITFMGGTNDWAQSVAIGTINDTTSNTFYGACKIVAQKLITRFPTKRILFLTPPFGKYPNRVNWSAPWIKNEIGLTIGDYGEVIIKVARMYGIPSIDIYGKCGWNDINIRTYVKDDGGLLHPNEEGGKRIGEVIVGEMKKIAPIN